MSDPGYGLVHLQREAESIYQEIEAAFGELTPELEERMRGNAIALAQKVDAYAFVLDMLAGREDALRKLKATIDARLKACAAHQDRLLLVADSVMTEQGTELLQGEARRIKRRKNPPRCEVTDEEAVRKSCPQAVDLEEIPNAIVHEGRVYKTQLNLVRLKALIKDGAEVAGAKVTQGYRLVVE